MKTFFSLVTLSAIIALAVGWVMNLIAVFSLTADTPLGWIVGRIVGIVIPIIGGVIGYF